MVLLILHISYDSQELCYHFQHELTAKLYQHLTTIDMVDRVSKPDQLYPFQGERKTWEEWNEELDAFTAVLFSLIRNFGGLLNTENSTNTTKEKTSLQMLHLKIAQQQ